MEKYRVATEDDAIEDSHKNYTNLANFRLYPLKNVFWKRIKFYNINVENGVMRVLMHPNWGSAYAKTHKKSKSNYAA